MPGYAGRLVGKLGFTSDALFGKCGRAALGPLRRRQHRAQPPYTLDSELLACLSWWEEVWDQMPPRELPLFPSDLRPAILYTDGCETSGGSLVGGVLDSPRCASLMCFAAKILKQVLDLWLPKKSMINQVEAAAGVVALDTWASLLVGMDVIHFVDSETALGALIKGCSPRTDTSRLVGAYWLRAARLRAFIYLDRVESKSNLADGPSRYDFQRMQAMGAERSDAVVEGLHAHGFDEPC